MARFAIIVSGVLLGGATASGTIVPVEVKNQYRAVSTETEVISDFGCNDVTGDFESAPTDNPWTATASSTAQCGFEPDAVSNATATQTSEVDPVIRFAATATIAQEGWGSKYTDPRTHEFFCSGAGGGGDAAYYVEFEVYETVDYHVVGVTENSGTGCTTIELNSSQANVFFHSFNEEFEETGVLTPGMYTLSANAYISEPAIVCGGGSGGGAFFDFSLEVEDACPADINDSGVVDVNDLISLILDWGPCPTCPQDIDCNGVVDVSDLILLILGWGICP